MTTIYGIEPDPLIWRPSRPFIQSKRWVKADPKGKRRRPARYPARRETPAYSVGYPVIQGRLNPVYIICVTDVPGGLAEAHRFMDYQLARFKIDAERTRKLLELEAQK